MVSPPAPFYKGSSQDKFRRYAQFSPSPSKSIDPSSFPIFLSIQFFLNSKTLENRMCMQAHVPRENGSWNVIFRRFEAARNASKISILLTDTGENFKLLMMNNLLSLFSPSWGLVLFNGNIGKINCPSYAVRSALTLIHRNSLNRSTSWYSVRTNIRST